MASIFDKLIESAQAAATMRAESERGFPDEARSLVFGDSPAEMAFNAAFAPVRAPVRLGALAASAMGASPDAEGAFVGRMANIAEKRLLPWVKELFGRGVPNEDVWKQTGWWKGPEGRLRYEVPDTGMTFRQPFEEMPKNILGIQRQKDMPLGGIISHRELQRAYPQIISNYRVPEIFRIHPDSTTTLKGEHTPPQFGNPGKISIWGKTGDSARETMAHELQHAIQSIEGFPLGADPAMFRSRPQLLEALERARANPDGLDPVTGDFDFIIETALGAKNTADDPFEAYLRTMGEAEARAVQKRLKMTPAELRSTFPGESYDRNWSLLHDPYLKPQLPDFAGGGLARLAARTGPDLKRWLDEAIAFAQKRRLHDAGEAFGREFPRHSDDGAGDAARHAYMASRVARKYSPRTAGALGSLYEMMSLGADRRSSRMDKYNNEVGISLHELENEAAKERIREMIKRNQLETLPAGYSTGY